MSKSSTNRLTGSRKSPPSTVRKDRVKRQGTTPRKLRRPALAVRANTLDAIDERWERIETLANLLEACGAPEGMNWKLAARAGYWIGRELSQVRDLVATLAPTPGGEP